MPVNDTFVDIKESLLTGMLPEGTQVNPLDYAEHKQAVKAALYGAVDAAMENRGVVAKSLDPAFLQASQMAVPELYGMIQKDISTTSPLTNTSVPFQGFAPVDMRPPAALLYPMQTPLRNVLPRTQGSGMTYNRKRFLGVSNTGTGGAANINIFNQEIPSGKTFANWPWGTNTSVAQVADQMFIPYKVAKLDMNLTWVENFAGRGFQDLAALASLQLLQSMMLGEELSIFSAQSTTFSKPATPTLQVRAPGTNETAVSGSSGAVFVKVTAINVFGESVPSTISTGLSVADADGKVVDVLIPTDVAGAHGYNVYVGTSATWTSAPSDTVMYKYAATGWKRLTIQGALPSTGATVPTADTGTGSSLMYDGLISVLAGNANSVYDPSSLGVYTGSTTRFNGGTGGTPAAFTPDDMNAVFANMYAKNKADPDDVWMHGVDRQAFAKQITAAGTGAGAYRIAVDQANAVAYAVPSMIYNAVTGKAVNLRVEPWMIQGNALVMSRSLPMTYSEVQNVVEISNVQDYLTIAWPQIDERMRWSIFMFGALAFTAPMFCGLIQGIPKQAATPYL